MKPPLLALLLLACINLQAQKMTDEPERGHFMGDLFLNANHNFEKGQTEFRLNRLHFGYQKSLDSTWYFKGMIESAREDYEATGDYNQITNLFEFCLGFKHDKLEGRFGLVGTELNQAQEKLWTHRNIDKVFADKYGFAPTNDFGFVLMYAPHKIISLDAAITNGEGHKTFQTDSAFRYALGITLKPGTGLVLRAYGDLVPNKEVQIASFIFLLGYQSSSFSIGAEYNRQIYSADVMDAHYGGLSFYASKQLGKKLQLFGRWDYVDTSVKLTNFPGISPWGWSVDPLAVQKAEDWLAKSVDGTLAIAGLQYQMSQNVAVAVDYRARRIDLPSAPLSYLFLDLSLSF